MVKIESQSVLIQGAKIHYLEGGVPVKIPVLFLHGASFSSQTWREIGSLEYFAEQGYRVVAVDLPSYGKSQSLSGFRDSFLLSFMETLGLQKPIVVSPSMSGNYSLPLVVHHGEKLRGFVAVAPVGISSFQKQLKGIDVPTLAIWGSNDRIVPVAQADLLVKLMPNAQKIILNNAGHACYLRDTDEFHQNLLQFFESVS